MLLPMVMLCPQRQGTSTPGLDSMDNWPSQEANCLIGCGMRQKPERGPDLPKVTHELLTYWRLVRSQVLTSQPRAVSTSPRPGPAPANLPIRPSKKLDQLSVQLRSRRTPHCLCRIQPHAPSQCKYPQLVLPPNQRPPEACAARNKGPTQPSGGKGSR